MSTKYEFKTHDEWHGGVKYSKVYDHVADHLRFHRGGGFVIGSGEGDWGPPRRLNQLETPLHRRLDESPLSDPIYVRALKDGFTLPLRRIHVADPVAFQMEEWARKQIGDRYILGAEGPDAWDCSGLTKADTQIHTGISLVHKATWQMRDPRVHGIRRDQIKPMDMIFLHGNWFSVDHVAYFLDYKGPGGSGRVIDAEPSDTGAPSGWPTPNLGTGIRIRTMLPGYYCGWENVVKIGRLYSVNGKP